MKMKSIRTTVLMTTMLALSTTTWAAKPIKVATGGPTGNYFGMANDIHSYCVDAIGDRGMEIINTSGSIEKLMGMTAKKFTMGWVQEDVLQFYSKQTPGKVNRNRMKVLVGGHSESVHILLPKGYTPEAEDSGFWGKVTGAFDFSAKPVQGIDLNLLKGQTIGSWGGSLVSAKALSMFAGLDLNIVEVPEGSRYKAGKHPILLVGGQPYGPVEKYLKTGKYDLVPIDPSKITTQAPFYSADNISYEIGGKITTIPSISVRALLVGKAFQKQARNKDMIALAQCVANNLEDLSDDPDTNPNWSIVYELMEAGAQTNWSYFSLQ